MNRKPTRQTPLTQAGLATASLVLFASCGELPKGSRPLTPEEEETVNKVIDALEITTPVSERLLAKARPLFDRHGNPATDNRELADSLYEVLGKIQDISEADRILMVDGTVLEGAARARGSSSEATPVDDYILIREPDADVGFYLEPNVLFHEGAHYLYGPHAWIAGSDIEDKLRAGELREQLLVGLEKKDLPYTLEAFYRIGNFWYESLDWSLRDTRSLIERQLPAVSEEQAQEFIDEQRTFLERERDRSTWTQTEAEYAQRYFGSEGLDLLEPLDLTQTELSDVLAQADELFDIHRENVEAALEQLREADAQYQPESRQERQHSMDARK